MKRKSIFGSGLFLLAVVGLLFTFSYRSSSIAQERSRQFTTPSSIPGPGNNSFSGRQDKPNVVESSVMLNRASYRLDKQVAASLTELLQLQSQSTIECSTKAIDGSEMVLLVVTTKPGTQQTITEFVGRMFPLSSNGEQANKMIQLPLLEKPSIAPGVSVPDGGKVMIGGIRSTPNKVGQDPGTLITLKVDEVTCGSCVQKIRDYLKTTGVKDIQFDSQKLTVSFRLSKMSEVVTFLETAKKENRFLAGGVLVGMTSTE